MNFPLEKYSAHVNNRFRSPWRFLFTSKRKPLFTSPESLFTSPGTFIHFERNTHQSPKFEVLLESGVNALAAGFTLEAVASFSAALERFYEYGIQVLSTQKQLPHRVYEQMFKSMSRQSERQLGAFLALYAIEFQATYAPNPNITEFRNAVIHKGQIPEPEKAQDFCEKVLGEIMTLYEKLAGTCETAMRNVLMQDLVTRSKSIPENMPRATSTGSFFFPMARTKPTFKDAFEEYIKVKQMLTATVPLMRAIFSGGPAQSTADK